MHKIFIGLAVIALIAISWLLLSGTSVDYVADVTDELSSLETELAEIDAAVQAGILTPEAAAEAQTKIVARIDAINTAAASGQNAKLTDAQRAQLIDGLERLKHILTKYQATLTSVDDAVLTLPESERPKLNRSGGSSRRNASTIAAEAITTADVHIEEIINDITDDALADEMASSTADTTVSDDDTMGTTTEDMMLDRSATSSATTTDSDNTSEEDTTDDTATTSPETTEENAQ